MAAGVTGDYDRLYSDTRVAQTRRSAEAVVPLVLELVPAQSVVDLGSGVGTWLAAFAARGIEDYLGIDGDWVPVDKLEIPRDRFRTSPLDRAFSLDRTFDLAVSLEVGEHLPEHAADALVESLARLAPTCCSRPPCRAREARTTSTSSGPTTGPSASRRAATSSSTRSDLGSGRTARSRSGTDNALPCATGGDFGEPLADS